MDKVRATFVRINKIVLSADLDTTIESELAPHYTISSETDTKNPSSFTLSFNLNGNADDATSQATAKSLAPYLGNQLRIYYTVAINENAVPDQPMQNTATETLNHKGDVSTKIDSAPKVIVGGKHLKKYDGNDRSTFSRSRICSQIK